MSINKIYDIGSNKFFDFIWNRLNEDSLFKNFIIEKLDENNIINQEQFHIEFKKFMIENWNASLIALKNEMDNLSSAIETDQ